MNDKRLGRQTVALAHPPSVLSFSNIGGKFEGQGPLADFFDEISNDSFFGEKTWEKAESAMQKTVLQRALEKAELTPEERYEKRLEQEKPVLDALLSWANEMQAKTAPKSALGKAIHYLLEQWPYLTRYLEDGRLELSNNRAERSMKPFVMGRKNWLFANTPGGAQASSVIYSLIETAKENGLDPYRYLLWLLQNAPQLSETNKAWAEKLLPANAPEECYMPHK